MAKKRYTHQQIRKSLKRDELREGLDRIVHYAKTNTENLLISAIIVVVILVLVPLYFRHQATNEMRSASLLDRALSYSMQPVSDPAADFGGGFKSAGEKYKKTQEAYAEVSNTYRGTRAGRLAGMGAANALYYQKQYQQALTAFQEQLDQHKNDFWTPTIRERIAACQENLGKWQDALAAYEAVLAQAPDYFGRRYVRLGIARCQARLGKLEEARRLLKAEQETEAGGYWSEQARQQLALLEQNQK